MNIYKMGFSLAGTEDVDIEHHNAKKCDPENFVYDCLTVEDVDKLLNESVECLSNIIKCAPSLAKTLLLEHRWCINEVVTKYRENASELLVSVSWFARTCSKWIQCSFSSSLVTDLSAFKT